MVSTAVEVDSKRLKYCPTLTQNLPGFLPVLFLLKHRLALKVQHFVSIDVSNMRRIRPMLRMKWCLRACVVTRPAVTGIAQCGIAIISTNEANEAAQRVVTI